MGSATSSSPPLRPFRLMRPTGTGTSRSRLRADDASAPQRGDHPQEHPLPLVPRPQPVQQPTTAPDDLAGHQDQRVDEPLELHPKQLPLLIPVGRPEPGMLG